MNYVYVIHSVIRSSEKKIKLEKKGVMTYLFQDCFKGYANFCYQLRRNLTPVSIKQCITDMKYNVSIIPNKNFV